MSWRDELQLLGIPVPDDISPDRLVAALCAKPLESTLITVALSALLFYRVEKGHNSKINSYWDATLYCSTCLSVGYGEIFARTPIGKFLGTLLMTIGPALANKTLDGPPRGDGVQSEILATLKEIAAKLA